MILGFLQGVTEFLPVSSSGHLVVYRRLFGLAETPLFFEVMVHLGTLLAVLVVFRSDLALLAANVWRAATRKAGEDRADLRLLRLVVLGTMPVVVVGLGWKDELQSLFSAPVHIGFAFLFTGLLLWLSRFAGRPTKDLAGTTWIDALLIGLAQALALVPGVSRSGATISIALLMGLDRRLAARYSFLLAIPAILGAITVQTADMGGISADQWAAVGAGTVMAAASGYVALRLLLRIVVAGRLSRFAYYCWMIGLATLTGMLTGVF